MSSGSKFLNRKTTERCVEMTIAREHIVRAVASHLRSLAIIHNDEEVTNIQFSDLFGRSDVELCNVKIFFEKEKKSTQRGGADTDKYD